MKLLILTIALLTIFRTAQADDFSVSRLNINAEKIDELRGKIVTTVQNLNNKGSRNYLTNKDRYLQDLNGEVRSLSFTVSQLIENFDNQLERGVTESNNGANNWVSEVINKLNQQTNQNQWAQSRAQPITNNFLQKQQSDQDECRNEAKESWSDYNNEVSNAVSQLENDRQAFDNALNDCSDDSTFRARTQCIGSITKAISNIFRSTLKLRKMNRNGNKLLYVRYSDLRCASKKASELKLEKLSVQTKLDQISRDARNHPNPKTVSSASSNTHYSASSDNSASTDSPASTAAPSSSTS